MVDHSAGDLPIFESGAMMWYLGSQHDPEGKLFPKASTPPPDMGIFGRVSRGSTTAPPLWQRAATWKQHRLLQKRGGCL